MTVFAAQKKFPFEKSGLRETQAIFQVEGPDLIGRFPPLRTLTASDAEPT